MGMWDDLVWATGESLNWQIIDSPLRHYNKLMKFTNYRHESRHNYGRQLTSLTPKTNCLNPPPLSLTQLWLKESEKLLSNYDSVTQLCRHVFAVLYKSPFAQTMTNDHRNGRGWARFLVCFDSSIGAIIENFCDMTSICFRVTDKNFSWMREFSLSLS